MTRIVGSLADGYPFRDVSDVKLLPRAAVLASDWNGGNKFGKFGRHVTRDFDIG